jgi:hypothetical protein
LFRCPSVKKLESALTAIPTIRDDTLREALAALAQEISNSMITRKGTQTIARGASLIKASNGEDLIMSLRSSDAPNITVRFVGHLDTPLANPLLAEILKLDNSLSLAALEALATRASRLRTERQEIKELLWAAWKSYKADTLLRLRARGLLIRAGERPGGRELLIRYLLLRSLLILAIMLYMLCMALITIKLPIMIFPAILGGFALIWWDARRLGARVVHGQLSATPLDWALSALVLSFVMVPLYLLNRQRIRRNAVPVDWDALLLALKAEGPHGDSLSITHPPSPSAPSPRR